MNIFGFKTVYMTLPLKIVGGLTKPYIYVNIKVKVYMFDRGREICAS